MPERTVSVFESILRLLWHVVEVYVFVVLIVKDHRIPDWNASKRLARPAPGPVALGPGVPADHGTRAGRVASVEQVAQINEHIDEHIDEHVERKALHSV